LEKAGFVQQTPGRSGAISLLLGEIIFFDWNGDGVPDHVGIVESSDSSTVYTIEGNWADSVHTDAYPINSSQIYGYGTPNYYE
jgi:CHAP domain.